MYAINPCYDDETGLIAALLPNFYDVQSDNISKMCFLTHISQIRNTVSVV